MPVRLFRPGYSHARALIEAGKYDSDSDWSLSPDEENSLLGDPPDWNAYGEMHLGLDEDANEETKARYKYPFGKGGKVYRSAVRAIRTRSAQQGVNDIFDAAGKLMDMMDKQSEGKGQAGVWYQIKAQGGGEAEIHIYGDIGESWDNESVTAANFVKELAAVSAKTIHLRINSYGGSVSDGLAIYNALRRHPAAIYAYVDGVAVSIASLIAMAGDTVTMAANGLMMVHAPWGAAIGNSADMRDMADVLDRYAEAMATSYMTKTGRPRKDVMAWLTDGKDHWFTAQEAVTERLADSAGEALAAAAQYREAAKGRFTKAKMANFFNANLEPNMGANNSQNSHSSQGGGTNPPPPPPAGTTLPPDQQTVQEAVSAALKIEQSRRAAIRASIEPFKNYPGIQALSASLLDDPQMSLEKANAAILAEIAKGAEPVMGAHGFRVESGVDERQKFIAATSTAIRARAGLEKTDGANPFRGARLLDIARACLDRIGFDYRGKDVREIVAAAFTQGTSDFPILLQDTMYKTLLAAYATAPDTWSRFCKVGSVPDFRANNRYRAGSFGNLDAVSELGEFTNKSIPDGERGTVTAGTKGNIINLSRQAIINDDMGAFVGLSQALGRAARRTIEADVYALLVANPHVGGVDLFSSTHANNATTGSAVTMASIEEGRQGMAMQLDVGGNDYLDIRPALWVGPMLYGGDARSVNEALYDPDTPNKLQKPNMVRGVFREVIDTPRISDKTWYMFADPNDAPVIEVAFLDGVQEPFLELETGFEVDGARYKVRLDYGVAAIDYRGAWRNTGPAS